MPEQLSVPQVGHGERDGREVLFPVEQAHVSFYDRSIIAVRLPDGRIAAVLSVLCDVIGLPLRLRRAGFEQMKCFLNN